VTERLYLHDPYVTTFEAGIVDRRDTEDGPAVVFRSTYFYPESGGQPWDLGTIDDIPIVKVLESENEAVLHVLERAPEKDRVLCRIDEPRRRDHMQQHSGQHILSAAFVREAGANTISFHLGETSSSIDLDKFPLNDDVVARALHAANEVVRRGARIESRFVDGVDASSLDLRKPPPDAELVRLVEIEGFDNQACCGTHPRSSAEVGPIVVRGIEKLKNATRVQFLCGERVLGDYRDTVGRMRALASVLSSTEEDIVAAAEKIQDERKTLGKKLRKLESEVLLSRCEAWMEDATPHGEASLLVKELEGLGPSALRTAAQALTQKPRRVVILGGVEGGRAHIVCARSADVSADAGALLRTALPAVDGQGGGSSQIAQGGGPEVAGLARALELAVSKVI
jgi:alanyl-tRNA synthetase